MNKKIYKGYELIKALEDEDIEAGTILIFTSTIDTTNKVEVEVDRKPHGLVLYKRNTIGDILPSTWLLNSKIEILEDNPKEIEEIEVDKSGFLHTKIGAWKGRKLDVAFADKINELVKAVNKLRKED